MMDRIQAWQQIYANVEKEQSPNKRGGFQTLFYTRSVFTEAEVEEMEARLLYFRSESEPVKVKRVSQNVTGSGEDYQYAVRSP